MNTKEFLRLGVPLGEATRRATDFVARFILGGGDKSQLHAEVAAIVANPPAFLADDLRKELAKALLNAPPPPRAEPVKYHQWGEGLDHEAVMQMEKACLLPVSVAGALMPDAHAGYGLPIGAVLGIIPGSMAAPGFIVSGKGNVESLNSASHGAGRAMSRKAANEKFNWKDVNRFLKQQGVTLISAGLDEVPMAYKDIRDVMAAQSNLVTVLGEFIPRLVKMAPAGERPED